MTVTKPIYNLFNTGILTKLCVEGSTSVDTIDPADVQCELAGDVDWWKHALDKWTWKRITGSQVWYVCGVDIIYYYFFVKELRKTEALLQLDWQRPIVGSIILHGQKEKYKKKERISSLTLLHVGFCVDAIWCFYVLYSMFYEAFNSLVHYHYFFPTFHLARWL